MISEGSCDTISLSLHIPICVIIFHCIFDQVNAPLVCLKDFFQKHKKYLPTPNFWTVVLHLLEGRLISQAAYI